MPAVVGIALLVQQAVEGLLRIGNDEGKILEIDQHYGDVALTVSEDGIVLAAAPLVGLGPLRLGAADPETVIPLHPAVVAHMVHFHGVAGFVGSPVIVLVTVDSQADYGAVGLGIGERSRQGGDGGSHRGESQEKGGEKDKSAHDYLK